MNTMWTGRAAARNEILVPQLRVRMMLITCLVSLVCLGPCAQLACAEPAHADDIPPSGVRLTIEDHQHNIDLITEQTGITISDWVWENYTEAHTHIEDASKQLSEWTNSLREGGAGAHGIRTKGDPLSLVEAVDVLGRKNHQRSLDALQKIEEQYWDGLRLHQVHDDLLTELRQAAYRRHLLPAMDHRYGTNVDVIALLEPHIDAGLDADIAEKVAEITRVYAADIMQLLLDQVIAKDAYFGAAPSLYDYRMDGIYMPPRPPNMPQRAARLDVLKGQLANRSAACVERLVEVSPSEIGERLLHDWGAAVYPFLWDAALEQRLARIDQTSPDELQGLAQEIRKYQRSMYDQLWQAQSRTFLHNVRRTQQPDIGPDPQTQFGALWSECTQQIEAYITEIDQIKSDGGDWQ